MGKDKITGEGTSTVQGILEDASLKSPPQLVVFIFYDLPNRDCNAIASNGEICCTYKADGRCDYTAISDCADGLKEYKEEYVDPFVSLLAQYKGRVPVALVIEPDSLPNLVTNSGNLACGNPATRNAYNEGIKYAIGELSEKTDASLYLDAAHGGWLGWENNMMEFLEHLRSMALPWNRMRGFATNVAGYQSLGVQCPWEPDQGYRNGFCLMGRHATHPCCADACNLVSHWNPANNELNYAQGITKAAAGMLGWNATAIIDTGRNGVAGMRTDCANWCNPRDAGAGVASTSQTLHGEVDAFFWLKTPGESDGCTQELPDGNTCPRFDTMCASADSIGSRHGEPRAPEAGQWFDYQVKQFAANANMGELPPSTTPTTTSMGVPTQTTTTASAVTTTVTPSLTTTATPEVTSTQSDWSRCGHDQDCAHPWGLSTRFTTECLSGGLGCNAMGLQCCRYCGFGVFAEIECPNNGARRTQTAASTMSLRGKRP